MLNFIGVQSNFTVMADARWLCALNLVDEITGEACDLTNTTFSGFVEKDGTEMEITIVPYENKLQISIPSLPEGRWEYCITATAETGENTRMLYGKIYAEGLSKDASSTSYASRTLDVRIPDDLDKHVTLEWQATTAAQLAAAEAQAVVDSLADIEEKADDALERAEEALGQLEDLENAVTQAESSAQAAETAKDTVEQMLADAPSDYIPEVGDNGNWYINGVDQGVVAEGAAGLDADAVTSHVVDSYADIPTDAESTNGHHVYYVDGTKYVWMIDSEGNGSWQATIANGVDSATVSSLGVVRLGSSFTLTDTAGWVGKNESNQLGLRAASANIYGSVKISDSSTIVEGVTIGYNSSGQLVSNKYEPDYPIAGYGTLGMVQFGSQHIAVQPQPYQLAIASTTAGQLCNNLLRHGAIVNMTKSSWADQGEHITPEYTQDADSFIMGLRHTDSFSQYDGYGLALKPASKNVRGGVTLATSLSGEVTASVLDTPTLNAALIAKYPSRTEVAEDLKKYILTTQSLMSIQVLTQEKYDALTSITASTLYLVY